MAQLAIAAVGAWLGSATLGATAFTLFGTAVSGAAVGWTVGSLIGSQFGPTQRMSWPRLGDLRVTGTEYGQPIPYVQGHPRVAPQIVWASERREIATTTEVGKGGGAESTSFTYEVDLLLLLTDNEIVGIARIWDNGELVYDPRSTADADTISASAVTERWSRLTVYTGEASQLPDPTYEAAVGSADAPAYRGRGTVFIEGLQLGNGGQIPNLTIEVVTKGSVADQNDILFQACFRDDSIEDESVYEHATTLGTNAVASGGELVCAGPNPAGPGNGLQTSGVAITAGGAWAVQCRIDTVTLLHNETVNVFGWGQIGFAGIQVYVYRNGADRRIQILATSTGGRTITGLPASYHFEMNCPGGASASVKVYVDGVLVDTFTYGASGSHSGGALHLCDYANAVNTYEISVDDFQVHQGQLHTAAFSPPASPLPPARGISVITIEEEDLDDVVSRLCLRAGMSAGQFDVTELTSITKPVRALAIGQIGGTRATLELLAAAYFFEAVLSGDEIVFRPRGGASVATIPYAELGASTDGAGAPEPLALRISNDLEIPADIAVSYSNVDADYNTATETSDRLVWTQGSTSTVQIALGFTASEAKAIADTMLLDQLASRVSADIALLPEYTGLEPTDVITVVAADGTQFRMRAVKKRDSAGLLSFEVVLDDASSLVSAGLTSAYTGQTSVLTPAGTVLQLMDIPILRDADNAMGIYAAVKGDASPYPGAALYRGLDDVTYSQVATFGEQAVIGSCTTTLAIWAGGNRFDDGNTVTVDVGDGTLSSATHADVLDANSNACLIGSEILQFKTATLVSSGVYRLAGLLRGRRGTEWAIAGHAASERFVLLQMTGLRRVELPTSDLGAERHYKGVTMGRKLSSAEDEPFTSDGVGLKPFSPVDLRGERDASGNLAGTFSRRTRLDASWASTTAPPLGETAESYEVDIYSDGTYATVERTISGLAAEAFSYSAADQTTDFGSPQAIVYLGVYQLSATAGRGYELQGAL